MQNIKKYSVAAILTLSVIAGIFSNIPLSSAHDTPIMANVALAYAQEANETTSMTNLTQTEEEEEEHATEDSHSAEEKEYNETSTVRE
ncbi:MAG: hypothetical protein EHM25_01070 [Nitrosopumilales archaeon]|nr:MAG: hypothetical protein EHM25_01070 [Nitrosopumilales archaeon]